MALARRTATRSRSPASARAAEQRSGSRSGANPRVPRRHNRDIAERTQATSEASEHEMPSLWPKSTAARNRSAASARAAEQRYESPWVSFRLARCGRLIELLHTRSQRPVTELEFRHALSGGASELMARLGNRSSRSTSHYLSTMARAITPLIRTRAESNSAWHDMLPAVIACAYCIANKSSARGRPRVVQTLYDFLTNRCDYAATQLLLEQALVRGDPLRSEQADDFWRNATDFEHQIAVTILEQSSNNVEAKLRDIKSMLGSS